MCQLVHLVPISFSWHYILLIHYLAVARNYLELACSDGRLVVNTASKTMRWAIAWKFIPTLPQVGTVYIHVTAPLSLLTHWLTWVTMTGSCGCELECLLYILAINPLDYIYQFQVTVHWTVTSTASNACETIIQNDLEALPHFFGFHHQFSVLIRLFLIAYVFNWSIVCPALTRCQGWR